MLSWSASLLFTYCKNRFSHDVALMAPAITSISMTGNWKTSCCLLTWGLLLHRYMTLIFRIRGCLKLFFLRKCIAICDLLNDHNKHDKWAASYQNQQSDCAPSEDSDQPVWSGSSLSAWRKLGSLATHWVHSKDSDQTGRMPRLIWVFAGRTVTLLVLSWGGSNRSWQTV